MHDDILSAILHYRWSVGYNNCCYWHDALSHTCHAHASHMAHHDICAHAPSEYLQTAYECIGTYERDGVEHHNEWRDAVFYIVFNCFGTSQHHSHLIRSSKYVAGACHKRYIGDKRKYYMCVRGYMS
jgi:hypothetical protein